ncbi:hypothetical protein J6590_084143, partial [Homalodisca vitripennis]
MCRSCNIDKGLVGWNLRLGSGGEIVNSGIRRSKFKDGLETVRFGIRFTVCRTGCD